MFLLQPGSIMSARWPTQEGEVDETLLKEADYLLAVAHEFRVRLKKMLDIREKVGQALSYPPLSFDYLCKICCV